MKFDTKAQQCPNCYQPIADDQVRAFQGVRICGNCARMVQRALDKMQKQLKFMTDMYNEVLRVALVKGELRFPELPDVPPNEKLRGVTREQLVAEMRTMAHLRGPDDHGTLCPAVEGRPEGHACEVHPLRTDPTRGE